MMRTPRLFRRARRLARRLLQGARRRGNSGRIQSAPLRTRVASAIVNAQIVVAALLLLLCHAGTPFGIAAMNVKTGSMEPVVPAGSMAYVDVSPTARESVRAGDVIVYELKGGTNRAPTVLHRVVDIDGATGSITTKGDANSVADPLPVPRDAVVGAYRWSIPFLGRAIDAFAERKAEALAAIVAVNAALLIVAYAPSRRRDTYPTDRRNPCEPNRATFRTECR